MKQENLQELEEKQKQLISENKTSEHIVSNKTMNINVVDEKYSYTKKGLIEKFTSAILRVFVMLVLPPYMLFKNGLKIKGRRNLKGLKTGAVSVSNHVLSLDSVMVAKSMYPKNVKFIAIEDNFKIPGIRHLVRLLGGVPIPTSFSQKTKFKDGVNQYIKEKKIVHFFAEGSMWPNYKEIRPFKRGAFHFASSNQVPVIPILLNFRTPNWFERLIGIKDNECITVHISKPIYPKKELDRLDNVNYLYEKTFKTINKMHTMFKALDAEHNKVHAVEEQTITIIK